MDGQTQAIAHQVYGPPGTGKTRYLSERVKNIVTTHGPEAVSIASFSVTAAREIASRGLGLPQRRVGTLHSFAFRSLGNGLNVALDPKVVADWNATVGGAWRITPDSRRAAPQAATEGGAQNTDARTARSGDELLAALDRARATFTDPADYPPDLAQFATAWTAWKQGAEAVDYTDMIEGALERAREGEPMPGHPSVFIVDEAQDNTPLETALVLAWGRQANSLVIALDDDQAIMEWRGGDPRRLLTLGQEGDGYTVDRHVLGKSWRVPRAVHAVAEQWVRRLSMRQEKVYAPRTRFDGDRDTGEIIEGAAFGVPESVQDPELADRIEEEISRDRTVMVIASCAYMLEPLTKVLRERGVPFHNPFRPSEARWNPLGTGSGTSTAERVFRYLVLDPDLPPRQVLNDVGDLVVVERSRPWTGQDVRAWLELVSAEAAGLRRGVKAHADRLPDGEVAWEQIEELFADPASLDRAVCPDLEWLAGAILPSKARQAAYALQVARKRGAAALDEKPKVVLGTIHCSPPDEPVLTIDGYVQIGELDPERHRLASFSAKSGHLTWNTRQNRERTRRGYEFVKAVNPYSGDMLTVTTDASRTRITPDHRVRVRFADSFMDKWAVYLMRRGDWWRVGVCTTARRPYRSGGVGGRLATEQADDGWILRVCETRREALIAEAQIQAHYGIPGLTFEAARNRSLESTDLHAVHASVAGAVGPRAKELLADLGLSADCPLYTRRPCGKRVARDLRGGFVTEARNILSGYMELPTAVEGFGVRQQPTWLLADVQREHYEGDIYSLEVLPHHYYVSGGAVVHNSVKGAAADIVYVAPDMSAAGIAEMTKSPSGRDQTIRLFYVAMTRAFEQLRLLAPFSSRNYLNRRDLLPANLEVPA